MYCPYCSTVLSDKATICTSCGASVKKDSVEFVAPKKRMFWYYVLIYFAMWAAAVSFGFFAYRYMMRGHWIIGIALAVLGVFCLYTRFRLAHHRRRGPLCFTLLCVGTTLVAMVCVQLGVNGVNFAGIFSVFAFGLIFTLLHYMYFEKRSLYFQN